MNQLTMAETFTAKVRPIGSSLCVIIPREVVKAEHIRAGKEVRVNLFVPDYTALDKLFGSVKETEPFERDRRDRV